MVLIEVVFIGVYSPIHWATTIECRVTQLNETTGEKVKFRVSGVYTGSGDADSNIFDLAKQSCDGRFIELYSNKDFDSFSQLFDKKFATIQGYKVFNNNCATAANFILDYFFPEPLCENEIYDNVRTCLGFTSVVTCGLFRCLPAYPCIDTPTDVFRKAEILKSHYGSKPTAKQEYKTKESSLPKPS